MTRGRGATKEIGNVLTDLYGWVGSDGGWRRTKVGMVIADVGLGQSASRGKINNPGGCVHRPDTAFGGCNVSASTLCIQGMWVGIKIGHNLLLSTPTDQSLEYEEPITLSETTTVKAIAIKDGISSSVTSRTLSDARNCSRSA